MKAKNLQSSLNQTLTLIEDLDDIEALLPLQVYRLKCDTLHDRVSSLEQHNSSLTSDLARLEGLQSRSKREAFSYTAACSLLAGALRQSLRRSVLLSEQKRLLSTWLEEKEVLEEELRRLAAALGDEEEEAGGGGRRGMVVRRWKRSVWVVRAARRWRSLGRQTSVMFQVEVGGARPTVGVCGGVAVSAQLSDSSGKQGFPPIVALCPISVTTVITTEVCDFR